MDCNCAERRELFSRLADLIHASARLAVSGRRTRFNASTAEIAGTARGYFF